jgi:cytochrome c-type biogenesis protein CcmH
MTTNLATASKAAEYDERLKALSHELRCMVCQNQTLADSNAELAVDLRNKVRALIEQGMSDAQIKTYLVERYGDFVLYKPPLQRNTLVLWLAPFALLLLGGIILRRVQVGRQKTDLDKAPTPTLERSDPNRTARARSLLDD